MNVEDWLTGKIMDPGIRVMAITGAADLGKSYLAERIVAKLQLNGVSATCLGLDSYLLPRDERVARGLSGYDPKSHDLDSARYDIERLLAGETVEYFSYRHDVGRRDVQPSFLQTDDLIVIEGLHSMHPSLVPFVDVSVFIFTSDDKLQRIRAEADMKKRKLTLSEAKTHEAIELESYYKHLHPYKTGCDVCLYLDRRWQYRVA